MRDNGIDVPDPDPNSDDPTDAFGDVMDSDDTEVQAAVDKCQEVLEDTRTAAKTSAKRPAVPRSVAGRPLRPRRGSVSPSGHGERGVHCSV
jgi:hypothetical protein